MVNRVNSFDDVLDRIDIPLMEIEYYDQLWLFLDRELEGHGVSQLQVDSAWARVQQLRQGAAATDLRLAYFTRRGQRTVALRDHQGRFITSEAANVTRYLEELEF